MEGIFNWYFLKIIYKELSLFISAKIDFFIIFSHRKRMSESLVGTLKFSSELVIFNFTNLDKLIMVSESQKLSVGENFFENILLFLKNAQIFGFEKPYNQDFQFQI